MERSPLHPHHQARVVNKGGVSSPSWERRGSSEGHRGMAPTTPGRSKMRPSGRGDETVYSWCLLSKTLYITRL
jgi:RPM1-interacting protein 4